MFYYTVYGAIFGFDETQMKIAECCLFKTISFFDRGVHINITSIPTAMCGAHNVVECAFNRIIKHTRLDSTGVAAFVVVCVDVRLLY